MISYFHSRIRAFAGAFAAALLVLAMPHRASAQDFTWNIPTGGDWFTAGNWTAGGPPNGNGHIARFGDSITASSAINVNGAATIGELNFTGITGAKAYTIGAAGFTITMNNNGSPVLLSSAASVASTGTQLIQSNLTFGANAMIAALDGGIVHVSGLLTGSGGLTKNGLGTLILTNNNTGLTGGIVINNGTLEARGESTFPPPDTNGLGANAVTVNAGGRLKLVGTGFWTPTNVLTIAGNGPTGAAAFQDVALWDQSSQYQGPIALSADASIRCEGFMFRGVAATIGLSLNGNRVRFAGTVTTVGGVDGVISDGSTAGGRVMIDIQSGNIQFNNPNNSYTGTTEINRGTLFNDTATSMGPGLGTMANRVIINSGGDLALRNSYTIANKLLELNGGRIICQGGTKTWTGAVTLLANSSIIANSFAGNFTFTGGININDKTLTLQPYFDDSVITVNSNPISGTGGVSITPVTGQGIVNFNVTNTYSGTTVLNSHRLFANAASATGTGPVTVGGGSLRGVGSIAGLVTVNSGSIAPGSLASPGTLTLNGGVDFKQNAQFRVRLVSNTSFDVLDVSGTALLGNATVVLDLAGATSNFNVGTDKLYILKMPAGQSLPGGTTFSAQHGTPVGSSSLYTFYIHYDYGQGGGVYLTPFPVPEPVTVLAIAAGGLGLLRLRRRSRA